MNKTSQPTFLVNLAVAPKPDLPFNDPQLASYLNATGAAWEQHSPTVDEVVSLQMTMAKVMEFQRHEIEEISKAANSLKQVMQGRIDPVPVGIHSHEPSMFFPDLL